MSSSLPRLLITGGNGQLASALKHHSRAREFQLFAYSHAELDITDPAAISRAIQAAAPDFVINTAAYTAVDKAEQETEKCQRANHLGAQNLAIACKKLAVPLLHLSTDYVFDGTKQSAYKEDDASHPVNFYGNSKWLGEQAIREQYGQFIILRVSGVFSEFGNNFLMTMLRLAAQKKEIRIVSDQQTCPTFASDIADAIYAIVKQPRWGTYHFCNAEPVSWYQFAKFIIDEAKLRHKFAVEEVKAISTAEYPTAAKRPGYSVLDCGKIKKDYGISQVSWEMAVKKILAKGPL